MSGDNSMVRGYFNWINERHAIYLRRQEGLPWPWTYDTILREYRFTNVFRELDTVTVWLRENWREPYADHSKLYFNIAMYRQFNWPPTMETIGYQTYHGDPLINDDDKVNPWDATENTWWVEDYQNAGNKTWTGAYIIRGPASQSTNPHTGLKWTSKADYMFHLVLEPVWQAAEPDWQSMTLQQAWEWWMQFDGFGPFLSYEVVTDMRHTRYLRNASDIMTWANAGPGAIRGLNRIAGWPITYNATQQEYNEMMRELLRVSPQYLAKYVPPLEMRDVEHCLCEYDKYLRVKLGEGRPRSKYTPST